MKDPLTREQRSQRMSLVRAKDTKPEISVRKLIHSLGYRYRLHARDLPGHPDLVIRRLRKVIFVHGCFWHRHSCSMGNRVPKTRVDFWREKLEGKKKRDTMIRRQLREGRMVYLGHLGVPRRSRLRWIDWRRASLLSWVPTKPAGANANFAVWVSSSSGSILTKRVLVLLVGVRGCSVSHGSTTGCGLPQDGGRDKTRDGPILGLEKSLESRRKELGQPSGPTAMAAMLSSPRSPCQHDPDLLLGRVLLSSLSTDLPHSIVCRHFLLHSILRSGKCLLVFQWILSEML